MVRSRELVRKVVRLVLVVDGCADCNGARVLILEDSPDSGFETSFHCPSIAECVASSLTSPESSETMHPLKALVEALDGTGLSLLLAGLDFPLDDCVAALNIGSVAVPSREEARLLRVVEAAEGTRVEALESSRVVRLPTDLGISKADKVISGGNTPVQPRK